jgi:hypothetical protein
MPFRTLQIREITLLLTRSRTPSTRALALIGCAGPHDAMLMGLIPPRRYVRLYTLCESQSWDTLKITADKLYRSVLLIYSTLAIGLSNRHLQPSRAIGIGHIGARPGKGQELINFLEAQVRWRQRQGRDVVRKAAPVADPERCSRHL